MSSDEIGGPLGVFDRSWHWIARASQSRFSQNVVWFTALTGFERVLAMAQTAVIANALGITDYGVFMFLFGTVGLVASNAGFQMGLTATVFVARYRDTDKARAAGVIAVVSRYAWLAAAACIVVALPFNGYLAETLLGGSRYNIALLVGVVFVGVSIVSGIQDGVAQGFEMFVEMAKIKLAVAVLVLASMYPVAKAFGLTGAVLAILMGAIFKCLFLEQAIWRHRQQAQIPARGDEVSVGSLVTDFALPSVAVTMLVGVVQWVGQFALSNQAGGFDQVAIINTGAQWRSPVLLLTATLGGVAVPAFGRLAGSGNSQGSRRLRRILSLVNLGISSATVLVTIAASGLIMAMYGAGFAEGRTAFCLIVLSTIPSVVANVYLQELVGAARMWRQFWLHAPSVLVMSLGFWFLVPRYQALGYAWALLIGTTVLLVNVVAADVMGVARERARASA
jgi:O-antigen/teichoic acid export membrane protein